MKVRTNGRREEGELRASKSVGVIFDVLKFRGCQAPTAPVLTQALPIRKLHNKCREGSDERTPRRRRTYFEGERRESTEAKQGHKTLVYTAV